MGETAWKKGNCIRGLNYWGLMKQYEGGRSTFQYSKVKLHFDLTYTDCSAQPRIIIKSFPLKMFKLKLNMI